MATILLIDDVELFLELEKSFLEGCGHKIFSASSAEEALARLDEIDPALILLDLYLPGIDGDELCCRLRNMKRWSKLPIIMVTAAGAEQEIHKCLVAGCDDYITKPINKLELVEKVNRLLVKVRRRTMPRVPVTLRVHIHGDGQELSACAYNLSQNGIYVKSRTMLAPGTAVALKLELPDGQLLPIMGKVKRVQHGEEKGMGIYFVHPSPQGVKSLQGFVPKEGAKSPEKPSFAVSPESGRETGRLNEENKALCEENFELKQRIVELEEENREFAQQIVEIEQINNNLTQLYIASSRLHSVLARSQVTEIIREVVINFIGAEKFALLLLNKDSGQLYFEMGEGFEEEVFPQVCSDEGIWQDVVQCPQDYFRPGTVTEGSDDPLEPLAAIPLKIQGRSIGILAIYRLFIQKERFEEVDHQIFSMMADHAATALFSSGLYEESERKRQTCPETTAYK